MAGTRLRTNLEGTDTEPCFLRGRGGNNCFQQPLGNELAALRTARFRPWSTLGDKLQRTPCRTRLLSCSSSPQPSRYPNLSPTLAESGAGQALGRTGDISAVGSSTEPQTGADCRNFEGEKPSFRMQGRSPPTSYCLVHDSSQLDSILRQQLSSGGSPTPQVVQQQPPAGRMSAW